MGIPSDAVGAALDARGWRCGVTIPSEMYAAIGPYLRHAGGAQPPTIEPEDWLVVLSQTCDVVAGKLDQEPLIEVLWCRPISKRRRGYVNRRSTRQLDFRPDVEKSPSFYLTAHATRDRYVVPRELFLDHAPRTDRSLSTRAVQGLQSWYALRYTRPAWPDEFVNLLCPLKEELEAALEGLSDDESELRVAISGNSDLYRLAVFLIIDEARATEPGYRQVALQTFGDFISILRKCGRIEIDDLSKVVVGNEFSWQAMQITEVWNFAALTPID
jgi:hypothetical protein